MLILHASFHADRLYLWGERSPDSEGTNRPPSKRKTTPGRKPNLQPFDQVGLSLFPGRHQDLKTDCSCPDWSNPCKHIAAVYYLLGEEFDRDPFLIFKLRGKGREDFLRQLGGAKAEMEGLYRSASAKGLEVFLGETTKGEV
jgi:hypothetical protein